MSEFELYTPQECTFGTSPDLDIRCLDDVVFHVDRRVLMDASPVWRKMLGGNFKEFTEKLVYFSVDSSAALRTVFAFMYGTQDIDAPVEADVTVIVDKYDLAGVRQVLLLVDEVRAIRLKKCQEMKNKFYFQQLNERKIIEVEGRWVGDEKKVDEVEIYMQDMEALRRSNIRSHKEF